MWAAVSIASARATASKMRVPVVIFGVDASAAEIFVAEVVSGSTTFVVRLKSIAASCSFGLRRATKACSAATAAVIGCPCMLQLVSSTSTTPNVSFEAWLAGTSVGLTTGPPFSFTSTSWIVRRRPLGSESTNVRTGNAGPFASTTPSPEPPFAPAPPASAPAARTTVAMRARRLTGRSSRPRPPRRAPARVSGRGRAAARCRASRTSGGRWAGGPWRGERPRSCRPESPRRSGT